MSDVFEETVAAMVTDAILEADDPLRNVIKFDSNLNFELNVDYILYAQSETYNKPVNAKTHQPKRRCKLKHKKKQSSLGYRTK